MTKNQTLSCCALAVLAACGEDTTSTTNPPGSESAVETAEAAPTFWADVAPILNEKCTACHQTGGIAPFALDNYADAAQWAPLMAAMTESRVMPPYLMQVGGECGTFDERDALTDAQIALIGAWADGDRLEGTPASMSPREPFHLADGLDLSTPEFTPQIEGGALAAFDEYRCFPVDLGLDEDAYITGFEVLPGNRRLVHHVIAMVVDPNAPSHLEGQDNAQVMAALDGQDDRAGWHCFGEAGDGVAVEGSPGGWAPGTEPYVFPEGIGVRLQPGRQVVLQVHYNMANPSVIGQSDQTRARLQLRPSVDRQAVMLLADAFLGTLAAETPAMLPPGDPKATYSWTLTGGDLGIPPGLPAELLSVGPHMHERGRKYTFEVGQDDSFACQGHVPRWDFNWQRHYRYMTPLGIDSSSQFRVTCEYDTSNDTQPVLPGWGTQNEMCEVNLMVAFPPGVQF